MLILPFFTHFHSFSLIFTHFLLLSLIFHSFFVVNTHFLYDNTHFHSFSLVFRCLLSVVTLSHFFRGILPVLDVHLDTFTHFLLSTLVFHHQRNVFLFFINLFSTLHTIINANDQPVHVVI